MPGHLVRDTRASLARALGHAGRLTRRHVSGEHLMTVWTRTRWPLSGSIWTPYAPGSGPLSGRKP